MVEPSVSLIASQVTQNSFSETGAGDLDLAVAGRADSATQAQVGVRIAKPFALGHGTSLSLEGRAAWVNELGSAGPTIKDAFSAAPTVGFALAGANPGANATVLGAGAAYSASRRLSLYARYDGSFGDRSNDRRVTAGVRFAW